jgi:acyl dehydratase
MCASELQLEGQHHIGQSRILTLSRMRAFSGGAFSEDDWPHASTHTEISLAKASGLEAPIAAGTQIEAYLVAMLVDYAGESWFKRGSLDVRFVKGSFEGDTITPHMEVERGQVDEGTGWVTWNVWCENQHGEKVAVGSAVCTGAQSSEALA